VSAKILDVAKDPIKRNPRSFTLQNGFERGRNLLPRRIEVVIGIGLLAGTIEAPFFNHDLFDDCSHALGAKGA
jgi:hypothetical protein